MLTKIAIALVVLVIGTALSPWIWISLGPLLLVGLIALLSGGSGPTARRIPSGQ